MTSPSQRRVVPKARESLGSGRLRNDHMIWGFVATHQGAAWSSRFRIRELIVSRIEAGGPRKVITGAAGVSPSTLSRLLRRCRETGQLAPGYGGGQSVKVDAKACGEIMAFHREHPDAYLWEYQHHLER